MARKKRTKPTDPAEAARKAKEHEAYTRSTPSEWGVNEEALRSEQNLNVKREAETRTRTARVYRYDAFGILASRGGLCPQDDEMNAARLKGVRRFEETLAQKMRREGTHGTGSGGGRPIPISDRSLQASQCLDILQTAMTPMLHGLLMKLVEPSVENGQPVNNWRGVVERFTGEFRHVAQASHVRACAAELLDAWQVFDNRERRAA